MTKSNATRPRLRKRVARYVACAAFVSLSAGILNAQQGPQDPGPRPGVLGAGGPIAGLNANEQSVFQAGRERFTEIVSVSGGIEGEEGAGLGPTFNANSCAACHAQPAIGGSSPAPFSPQVAVPNPQVAMATLDRVPGANNVVPSFITADGPVREARFISTNPDNHFAPLDGGVHDLFTIKGRVDAVGCNLAQPDFEAQLAKHNVVFRIPTPVFGLGLVENTPDLTLQTNLAADASRKGALGISGRFNTSGNDGTITRFGWKAQNKSLLIFAAEAYNVEMGVTSEGFPNKRSGVPGCVFNPTPEDSSRIFNPDTGGTTGTASQMSADSVNFALFMRLSAPPVPTTSTSSELSGQAKFSSIGCDLCHSPTLVTGASPVTAMGGAIYHPYSDFALHHMGSNLADGINQGAAGPDEFRTAPLWGVGQRLFFLHDGRTRDLLQAILAHASPGTDCVATQSFQQFKANGVFFLPFSQNVTCASEANGVISNFNRLSSSDRQDILNFLRSL